MNPSLSTKCIQGCKLCGKPACHKTDKYRTLHGLTRVWNVIIKSLMHSSHQHSTSIHEYSKCKQNILLVRCS